LLFAAHGHAAQERYDYDTPGRLIRVITSVYKWDRSSNFGQARTALPREQRNL